MSNSQSIEHLGTIEFVRVICAEPDSEGRIKVTALLSGTRADRTSVVLKIQEPGKKLPLEKLKAVNCGKLELAAWYTSNPGKFDPQRFLVEKWNEETLRGSR